MRAFRKIHVNDVFFCLSCTERPLQDVCECQAELGDKRQQCLFSYIMQSCTGKTFKLCYLGKKKEEWKQGRCFQVMHSVTEKNDSLKSDKCLTAIPRVVN